MKLLVIGGTSFVGRHAVECAVERGHEVTVFHRGRTNPDLLSGRVEHRTGDRNAPDYSALEGGETWDAVLDVCAYVPRHVGQLAEVVGTRAGHYVHVSSVSAYDESAITPDEDSPLAGDLADPAVEDITDDTYGPLKAMCERAGLAAFGEDRTAIVRPTYVCGPHDRSDRFTYWARRVAGGGRVAVLDTATPMQIVDARDLGRFLIRLAEDGTAGAFDGVGPFASVPDFLSSITPDGVSLDLVPVAADVVEAAGVFLPIMSTEPVAFMSRPAHRAREAGLQTRSAADTAAATRAWDTQRGSPELVAGPSPEQEAALLASIVENPVRAS
jgi:2'-hydroxyisoflavone reductase